MTIFHNVGEDLLNVIVLSLAAVSEQDSETTETSKQEPSTPSEESSPVKHTHTHTSLTKPC